MEILADAMPEKAAIPRPTDGIVDIQSLLGLLAEQVVNAIMDEEADQLYGDGANSMLRGRARDGAGPPEAVLCSVNKF